ncbi:GMC oxidoreductase [Ceratobasidium sp. AG-Ba]|nr:GMC oxidoreductase [Ceratobasidium sp. AG-Ba]QRW06477.1 GMC oxidoreductase [Ceratobasidium sp. AG-Ba]
MPIFEPTEFCASEFDYLVVGGGTAGLVVAARLSEDPAVRVGVLEAGQYVPDDPTINVPGYFGRSIGNPNLDWGFLTVPQKDANGRLLYHPRGKVLGGSSALNFMTLGRGSEAEYDAIEALGNPGWNFASFQSYFSKSETANPLPDETAKTYGARVIAPAGTDGPIARSYPTWFSDLHVPLFGAYKALGVDVNVDPNGGKNTGITTTACAITPGKSTRSYSVTGYWEPYAERPNLVLVTGARATKVTLSKQGDLVIATGVEFVHGPEGEEVEFVATARREVVLSAGTFQSPQLLELSGIGQRRVLEAVGIPVQVELNGVGENLQDHLYVPTMYEVTPDHETLDVLHEPEIHAREWEKFQTKGEGMYAATHSAFSFLPLEDFAEADEAKRVRDALAGEVSRYSNAGGKKLHGLLTKWASKGDAAQAQTEIIHYPGFFPNPVTRPTPGRRYQSFLAGLMHPASRGTTHIVSSDALAKSAIDPRYLSAPADVEILAAAVRFIARLSKAGPMGERVIGETMGAQESNEDVKEYVKNKFEPIYHPIGTCSMLPHEDGGVVDSNLKVYGTANLRVVDASVIPIHLSCHIQSTIYAIAEKASDLIKATA